MKKIPMGGAKFGGKTATNFSAMLYNINPELVPIFTQALMESMQPSPTTYDKKYPTFRYQVNADFIADHFREHNRNGKYITYVSKYFYGAVIRSEIPLVRLDNSTVAISVRLKGHGGRKQNVTGIKIDIMPYDDERLKKYNIAPSELPAVDMQIVNIPGNILLNAEPTLLTAFFYKRKDGSTVINFVEQ